MAVVVWFKRDLRVVDHAPLVAAARSGEAIIPLYVFEPELYAQPDASQRHWLFIRDCLSDLDQSLRDRFGAGLWFRQGDVGQVFAKLAETQQISAVYAHEETGNLWTYDRDVRLAKQLKSMGISFEELPFSSIKRRLKSRDDWGAYHNAMMSEKPHEAPKALNLIPDPTPCEFTSVATDVFHEDHGTSIQQGGRTRGLEVLGSFIQDRARLYRATLSTPNDSDIYSSRLSAHLAYGSLSVREVFHQLWPAHREASGYIKSGLGAMMQRLHWRDHFIQKLEDQPEIEIKCMHPMFEGLREPDHDEGRLQAWFQGQTGVPIVDAVMRCVQSTGWVNFRMRAMVTSFASYDLWLDWRKTGPLLGRLWTDYEPGIHYSQMQMQSGVTGINTFRIYNPFKQSQDHDSEGTFIRKWVPELANVPTAFIHDPQQMNIFEQNESGVVIGKDYPLPIVDHQAAVRQARAKISSVLKHPDFKTVAREVYLRHGSRSKSSSRRHFTPGPKADKKS